MKKAIGVIILLILAFGLMRLSQAQMKNEKKETAGSTQSSKAEDLRIVVRDLWNSHVTWTRSYIVSALDNLEDLKAVTDRLLTNQDDIGSAIKPYYGEDAGNKLASLLRDHIMAAAAITKAAKDKNDEELKKAKETGKANADSIAELLSSANPDWDKQAVKNMLYKHLEYVTEQVDYRLKKDWTAEIKAYDEGLKHMLGFADVLAAGIAKQFPDKLKE